MKNLKRSKNHYTVGEIQNNVYTQLFLFLGIIKNGMKWILVSLPF